MYLSLVEIKNNLSYKDFKIEFNKGVNIIVGANGSGKSNLLKLIRKCVYENEKGIELEIKFDNHESRVLSLILILKIFKSLLSKNIYVNNFDILVNKILSKHRLVGIRKNSDSFNLTYIFDKENDTVYKQYNSDNQYYLDDRINKLHELNNLSSQISQNLNNLIDFCNDKKLDWDNEVQFKIREYNFKFENIVDNIADIEKENINNILNSFNDNLNKLESISLFPYITRSLDKLHYDFDRNLNYNNNYNFAHYLQDINKFLDKINYHEKIYDQVNIENYCFTNLMNYLLKCVDYLNGIMSNYKLYHYKSFAANYLNINDSQFNELLYDNLTEEFMDDYTIDPNLRNLNYFKLLKDNKDIVYDIIQKDFFEITGKYFDVVFNDDKYYENIFKNSKDIKRIKAKKSTLKYMLKDLKNNIKMTFDAKYVIKDTNYNCSYGEIELINFLLLYHTKEKGILLIDEPCSHLSSQYKVKLRNKFLKNKNVVKQIILVTHDSELIDLENCKNVTKFTLQNNRTKIYSLKDFDSQENKLVCENKEILFINKALVVEGYYDSLFYGQLLDYIIDKIKKYNNLGYEKSNILIQRGCQSQLHILLEKLNVKYHLILDYDKIYGTNLVDSKSQDGLQVNEYNKSNDYTLKFIEEFGIKLPNLTKYILIEDLVEKFNDEYLGIVVSILYCLAPVKNPNEYFTELDKIKTDPNTKYSREHDDIYIKKLKHYFNNTIDISNIQIDLKNMKKYLEHRFKNFKCVNDIKNCISMFMNKVYNTQYLKEIIDFINLRSFRQNKIFVLPHYIIDLEGLISGKLEDNIRENLKKEIKNKNNFTDRIELIFYDNTYVNLINFLSSFIEN